MLRTFSTLAVAATLGGGGAAAAVAAPHIQPPKAPSITVKSVAVPKMASAVKRLAELKVKAPTINSPDPPRPDLRPVGCTATTCSPEDPTDMAGTVVSFTGSRLTERTSSGPIYTASVDDKTNVACPTQQAIDDGQVFNPATPSIHKISAGQTSLPAKPKTTDKYVCSATNITAGRHVAGAELGRDSNGQLHWIAIALSPH